MINEMTSGLKFVKSVEFVRYKEKQLAKLKVQKRKGKSQGGEQKKIDRENKKLSESKNTRTSSATVLYVVISATAVSLCVRVHMYICA